MKWLIHFIQRYIFRFCLLTIAVFTGLVLLSLNIFYIIYIILLPPLRSQLNFDGYNCAQRRILVQMLKAPTMNMKEVVEQLNFSHVQSVWFIFATPVCMQYFMLVVCVGFVISILLTGKNTKKLLDTRRKRLFVLAYMQHKTFSNVELSDCSNELNDVFRSLLNALVFAFSMFLYADALTTTNFTTKPMEEGSAVRYFIFFDTRYRYTSILIKLFAGSFIFLNYSTPNKITIKYSVEPNLIFQYRSGIFLKFLSRTYFSYSKITHFFWYLVCLVLHHFIYAIFPEVFPTPIYKLVSPLQFFLYRHTPFKPLPLF